MMALSPLPVHGTIRINMPESIPEPSLTSAAGERDPAGQPVAAYEHRDQLVFCGAAKYQRRNDARELDQAHERYRL